MNSSEKDDLAPVGNITLNERLSDRILFADQRDRDNFRRSYRGSCALCLTGCTLMQQIAFYMLIASLTIATPGPGVLFTLTNTLNYSLRHAMAGIIGVAAGMGVIAIVAASSVGAIITTSQLALLAVKVTGAAYLIYLGSKLFRSVPPAMNNRAVTREPMSRHPPVKPRTAGFSAQSQTYCLLYGAVPAIHSPAAAICCSVFDTGGYFSVF
jgi:hypothetical protein